MSRIAYILLVAASIFCYGCQSQQARAMLKKYETVKPGMTHSEVYAIAKAPDMSSGTIDGKELESWHYGWPFANEDYIFMTVLFGKDGRVVDVHFDTGRGHAPRVRGGLISND